MKEGLPRSACSARPVRDEGRPLRCCTPDWISAASVSTTAFSTRPVRRWRRVRHRQMHVEIADAVKVKGLAPLACKTDRIDAWVLAELSRRDLVPAIWL